MKKITSWLLVLTIFCSMLQIEVLYAEESTEVLYAIVGEEVELAAKEFTELNEEGIIEYQFSILEDEEYLVLQEYSKKDTYLWVPKKEGKYVFLIEGKNAIGNIQKEIREVVVQNIPLEKKKPSQSADEHKEKNIVNFSQRDSDVDGEKMTENIAGDGELRIQRFDINPNGQSVTKGAVELAAEAQGGDGKYQYCFWVKRGKEKILLKDFSNENTYIWTPFTPAKYIVVLEIKDGSGNRITKEIEHEVIREKLTIVEFNIDKEGIIYSGDRMNMTSLVTGGSGKYQYQYYVVRKGEKILLKDFSSENNYTWTPITPAEYELYVVVKDSTGTSVSDKKRITVSKPVIHIKEFNVGDGSGNSVAENNILLSTEIEKKGSVGEVKYKYYVIRNGSTILLKDYDKRSSYIWTPITPAEYKIIVEVKDANGYIWKECKEFVVRSQKPLSIDSFEISPEDSVVKESEVTLSAKASGGNEQIEYCYYVKRNGEKILLKDYSKDNTYVWHPVTPEKYSVYLEVRDGKGRSVVTSKEYEVKKSALEIKKFEVSPKEISEANTPIEIESLAHNGTGLYQYRFYVKRGKEKILLKDFSEINKFTWIPFTPAKYQIVVEVRDDSGEIKMTEVEHEVIDESLKVESFNISTDSTIYVGENVSLETVARGGGKPYDFQYYVIRNGNSNDKIMLKNFSSDNKVTWTPFTPAKYDLYVVVRDSLGREVSSKKEVEVFKSLVNIKQLYVGNGNIAQSYQNVPISVEIEAKGAVGELQYQYYVERNGEKIILKDFGKEKTCLWKPFTPALYQVYVEIKDSKGVTYTKNKEFQVVSQQVFIDCFSKSVGDNVYSGTPVVLKANARGGQGQLNYKFYVKRNGNEEIVLKDFSTLNSCTWTPITLADYDIYVDVKDKQGLVVTEMLEISVVNKQMKGIDVSAHQGKIEWSKVKQDNVNFAMLRVVSNKMGALKVDDEFYRNISEANKNGIPVGGYRYGYAMTEEQAQQEAKMVVNAFKASGIRPTYPIAYDVEDAPTQGQLPKSQLTKIIKAFKVVIEMNGYKFMIYSNKNWLDNKLEPSVYENEDVWIARYRDYTPNLGHGYTGKGNVTIWQYSDRGNVSGIRGNVDMNIGYHLY